MLSLFLTAASPRIVSYYFVLFVLLPFDYYVLITHLPSEEWGCIYTKGCITAVITSKTKAYQNHEPCSFSITIASIWEEFEAPTFVFSHSNPEVVKKKFISKLEQIRRKALRIMGSKKYPIDMSEGDEQAFQDATECFMCGRSEFSLTDKKWIKARDHDHYLPSSNYRSEVETISRG